MRVGWVWVTYGRERERKGSRERPWAALNMRGRGAPRGRAPARLLPSLQATGARAGVSGVFLDVDYVGRDREREWGEVRDARL